jgi:hypothetical protein
VCCQSSAVQLPYTSARGSIYTSDCCVIIIACVPLFACFLLGLLLLPNVLFSWHFVSTAMATAHTFDPRWAGTNRNAKCINPLCFTWVHGHTCVMRHTHTHGEEIAIVLNHQPTSCTWRSTQGTLMSSSLDISCTIVFHPLLQIFPSSQNKYLRAPNFLRRHAGKPPSGEVQICNSKIYIKSYTKRSESHLQWTSICLLNPTNVHTSPLRPHSSSLAH